MYLPLNAYVVLKEKFLVVWDALGSLADVLSVKKTPWVLGVL
jgi:hypothetical protein